MLHPTPSDSLLISLVALRRRAPSVLQRGLTSAAVAWGAAMGMLLGLGRRGGTTWRPLNAAAHGVLGSRADDLWGFSGNVTLTGGLVVLAVSAAAGVATAWLASSRRSLPGVAAAAAVALVGYLVHLHVVARAPGGLASLLSTGELRALYFAVAIALFIGMRYAFLSVRETPAPSDH